MWKMANNVLVAIGIICLALFVGLVSYLVVDTTFKVREMHYIMMNLVVSTMPSESGSKYPTEL